MHCQFSVQESLQNCLGHNLVKEKVYWDLFSPQSKYFAGNGKIKILEINFRVTQEQTH